MAADMKGIHPFFHLSFEYQVFCARFQVRTQYFFRFLTLWGGGSSFQDSYPLCNKALHLLGHRANPDSTSAACGRLRCCRRDSGSLCRNTLSHRSRSTQFGKGSLCCCIPLLRPIQPNSSSGRWVGLYQGHDAASVVRRAATTAESPTRSVGGQKRSRCEREGTNVIQ